MIMSDIDDRTEAQARFPGYEIRGSGRVIVLLCEKRAVMCSNSLEALKLEMRPCEFCQCYPFKHATVRLDTPKIEARSGREVYGTERL